MSLYFKGKLLEISDSFRKQTDKENECVSETYALFMYDGVKRTSWDSYPVMSKHATVIFWWCSLKMGPVRVTSKELGRINIVYHHTRHKIIFFSLPLLMPPNIFKVLQNICEPEVRITLNWSLSILHKNNVYCDCHENVFKIHACFWVFFVSKVFNENVSQKVIFHQWIVSHKAYNMSGNCYYHNHSSRVDQPSLSKVLSRLENAGIVYNITSWELSVQ